ncbi:MAG TPA: hypothetical protein VK864_01330, partial [Longimicrobiales bacterium]|nr:hypothetical protein [Longimicrobiales bacterium]
MARLRTEPVLAGGLALLSAWLVYAAAVRNGFAYDDVVIVTGDPRITQFQFSSIFTKPYWSAPGFALYRPIVSLSFAADWALSNGSAAWFHVINAVWHGLATAALFALLLAWFTVPASLAAALVFAVHPVHVEAVANVVGRAELMAAAFGLLACALWAHERPRSRPGRALLVMLCVALALLCKESSAVLPALFVLIDAARQRWSSFRDLPGYLRSRAPELAALMLMVVGATALRGAVAGGLAPTQLDPVMEVMPSAAARIRTAFQIWPEFIRLLFFPRVLLADYGPLVTMPLDGWTLRALGGMFLALTSVMLGLWLLDQKRSLAALALLWFPITILPVANLIVPIGILLAERTLYFPSAALAFAVALGWRWITAHRPTLVPAATAVCVIVLALLAGRTIARVPEWDSTDRIMTAQLRDRPDSFRAVWHSARMAKRDQKPREALELYARAARLWPWRERLIVEAAAYAAQQGDARFALQLSRHGTVRWPGNLQLQRLVAGNALDLGDTTTARHALDAGLRLAPNDSLLRRMAAA